MARVRGGSSSFFNVFEKENVFILWVGVTVEKGKDDATPRVYENLEPLLCPATFGTGGGEN